MYILNMLQQILFFLHHNDAATTKTVCLMINWSAPWMQKKITWSVCDWQLKDTKTEDVIIFK